MIIQEPVQAAIWHCLNHYAYQDAIFLAERLCTEIETEESLFLLATCYYRSGQVHQAHWLLNNKGAKSPECRFLMAKCAYELKQLNDAENYLSQDEHHINATTLDAVTKEFGDIACFALQLLAKICQKTERASLASDASRKAIKLNPFLFQTFMDLCDRGERPDPKQVFAINDAEIFQTTQATQGLSWFGLGNHMGWSVNGDAMNYLDLINTNSAATAHILGTPTPLDKTCVDLQTPLQREMTAIHINLDGSPPVIMDETPNPPNSRSLETPFRKSFKYLSSMSPHSPSFGVLPIMNTPANVDVSPASHAETLQLLTDSQKANNHKKLKGQVINTRKEQPLQSSKQMVFGQTGANIGTPKTPSALGGQNVRRSSRLFSNNYSVKENNKSPNINKFAAPRSPPRKSKTRSKINLSNTINFELNEKADKEKVQQENVPVVQVVQDQKVLINNSINNAQSFAQQLLHMKKQSAEGLMTLLRDLGQGYLHLAHYECQEAIKCFEEIPLQHTQSSWVQSQIAMAHHEQRQYETAVKIFQEIHDREPHRLEMMEIYSTGLWHLQKDVMLSALAQDLMAQNKESPITWCAAGNCFSAHKEHETAIKFFQRAIQVDPDFAYSYTLLGHELVLTEELDKALSYFRTAILHSPRHYNAWFGIGTVFSKQERYQLAEIHYTKALQINPKNSVLMVHIGVMQFFLNKVQTALQTLNQAIQLDPKNPLSKFHRGSMYFSIGKYQDALRELEDLKQIVPKESVVYYLIGKIHKKLGNTDLALMYFSWATDLDPKGANNQIKDNFDSIIRTQDTTISGSGSASSNQDANQSVTEGGVDGDANASAETPVYSMRSEGGLGSASMHDSRNNVDYDSDSF